MKKINEREDISRKVLDVDIHSELFEGMIADLNAEIKRGTMEVHEGNFEEAEITLKLKLQVPLAYETIEKEDNYGQIIEESYSYKSFSFDHNVGIQFKKKYSRTGAYNGLIGKHKRELKFEDGRFVAVPVRQAQMSIEDLEGIR